MIRYVNVWKYYGGRPVIKSVDLSVGRGKIKVLLGPNGSGKSTLFKMSVGLVRPEQGEVWVGSVNVLEDPITARRMIGFMPEEPLVYESLEAMEYLEFMLSIYGVRPSRDKVEAVVKALGLNEHLGKLVGELSYGNKRKVMLAAIMLRDPSVLVLDEVFSGLDVGSARTVKAWLVEKANSGSAVLVSTHILPLAETIADKIAIIHGGKIVAEGSPGELKEELGSDELEELYLKLTGYSAEIEELVKALSSA